MIKSIKHSFKCVFNEPSVYEVAKRELEHVRHSLLEAQTAKEYAEAMVTYHNARINRLTTFLLLNESQRRNGNE